MEIKFACGKFKIVQLCTMMAVHGEEYFSCFGVPQLDEHVIPPCHNLGPIRCKGASVDLLQSKMIIRKCTSFTILHSS